MKALRFFDIAVNLTDCVFRGIDWKGRQVHVDDFDSVLERARSVGVQKILVSGTNLEQCERAIALCKLYPNFLFCTVGVHPAHCAEFLTPIPERSVPVDPRGVTISPPRGMPTEAVSFADETETAIQRLNRLRRLVDDNRDVVLAIGEIGLDGAETAYCPMDVQKKCFAMQLQHLVAPLGLPVFLHSRDCGTAFAEMLRNFIAEQNKVSCSPLQGVVHSFNGSQEELGMLLQDGMMIGINASAFRTEETARLCCQSIPIDRLILETDAPWCDPRKTDFGFRFLKTQFPTVKRNAKFVEGHCIERRNEPCHILSVLEMYCGAAQHFRSMESTAPSGDRSKNDDDDDDAFMNAIASASYRNSERIFLLS